MNAAAPDLPAKRWPERLAAPVFPAESQAMQWWQSRHNLPCAPQLVDLHELANAIRRGGA